MTNSAGARAVYALVPHGDLTQATLTFHLPVGSRAYFAQWAVLQNQVASVTLPPTEPVFIEGPKGESTPVRLGGVYVTTHPGAHATVYSRAVDLVADAGQHCGFAIDMVGQDEPRRMGGFVPLGGARTFMGDPAADLRPRSTTSDPHDPDTVDQALRLTGWPGVGWIDLVAPLK